MIHAEWQKIWSVRSSRIYLAATLLAGILAGVLFSLTIRVTQGRPLAEFEPMQIVSVNMLGVDVASIFLLLFIAMQIGREFQEKTIQSYLSATPARVRYFFAKTAVFFLIALVTGVVVALSTQLSGRFFVASVHKQMPPSAELWQFTAGVIVMPVFYALLTVCAPFSARNTAGGIAAPVFVLFLPELARFFPDMLQATTIPALPASAIHTLSGTAEKGSLEYTGVMAAFLVLGSWLLLSGTTAIWKFRKLDI
ncbi:MAG: ABC transporter permease [Bacillota bacterium]|nr:ABC transporter permease [Bacillota bacterium]